MNRIDHIYPAVICVENLYRSVRAAARGKRFRETVARFFLDMEAEVQWLHSELASERYRPGAYRTFTIRDPKTRAITVAPFRDRVVHHAIHDVIEPLIDKTFIYDSYACRRGKGTHKAVERAQGFLRANRYCLHGDIRKYFHSVDHAALKELIRLKITDEPLLRLIDRIIDSAGSSGRGVPIGNLTSQLFANLYLNELDRFVKFGLRQRYYIRYMDDFLIFGDSDEGLEKIRARVGCFLRERLHLDLNASKSQIHDTRGGVTFLGLRLFAGRRRLASGSVRRVCRRVKQWGRESSSSGKFCLPVERHVSLRAWFAYAKNANSVRLRGMIVKRLFGGFSPGERNRFPSVWFKQNKLSFKARTSG